MPEPNGMLQLRASLKSRRFRSDHEALFPSHFHGKSNDWLHGFLTRHAEGVYVLEDNTLRVATRLDKLAMLQVRSSEPREDAVGQNWFGGHAVGTVSG